MGRDFRRYHRERCASAPTVSGYYERFPSQEPPFRPNLRYINPDVGYEAPHRSARTAVPGAGESTLDQRLIDRNPDGWRPCHRYIDPGSGSRSEKPFRPCVKKVPGPPDNRSDPWRSSKHAVKHVDESKGDDKWRSTRHRPSIFEDWYLDASLQEDWRSTKKPARYTHQPEWVPPFREYEGKVPQRFYSIVPGKHFQRRPTVRGKRKSTKYNQFATTFDKDEHFDEFKRPLGGIKTRYRNEHQWPFTPLPPPRNKKQFYTHVCHHEGVSTLMNPKRDYDYNSYVFL
ncbi:hypothetical protein SELMODRAFT_422048 [Selaginella moellendorffii]|uniref:Uncharacterized protein n=1 Tax=Selaginella moellendorffii TaxID=88036 RepID=D8SH65_SELML|nr:hypothetical protein SELMODRAFT_422048 [Selaginella moellendorffii]